MLLVLLALPLMGAAAAIFQEPLGLTLANPNGFGGGSESHVPGIPDGAPSGNVSLAIAVGIVIYLFAASIFIGMKWDRKKFLISSVIFWSIFAVLFTTFFTNTGQGLRERAVAVVGILGSAAGSEAGSATVVLLPDYDRNL